MSKRDLDLTGQLNWGGNLHDGTNVVPARNLMEKNGHAGASHNNGVEGGGKTCLQGVFRIQKENIDSVVVVICGELGQDLQRVAREVPARALPKKAACHGKRVVDNYNLSTVF